MSSAQQSGRAAASVPVDAAFKQQLRQFSQFFDHLVELVPAKFYIDSGREDASNVKYLKKSAKAEAKRQAKDAAKKRKREKLDPGKVQTTLEVQREQASKKQRVQTGVGMPGAALAAPEDAADATGEPTDGEQPGPSALRFDVPTGSDPSSGQLREKLQARIEELRRERKAAEEKKQRAKAAKDWRKQASGRLKRPAPGKTDPSGDGAAQQPTASPTKKQKQSALASPAVEDAASLTFGRLELGAEGRKRGGGAKKKQALSKAELLEAARAKAEERAATEGTRQGRVAVEQDAWKAAMARARGERVLDDPKLLSRSLKKEQKMKQKKSLAWKERQGLQRKEQATKQKKRADNLKARTDTKLQNRKDKREKKLMRAGFEGRRNTFIGTDK